MACTRKDARTHAQWAPGIRGGGGANTFARCWQAGVTEKAPSLSPTFRYLSKTEGVTNLSECHPCFAIPLFVTQPPSTSCLEVITEDVEKQINVSISFCERVPCDRLGGPSVINLITSIYSTWFLWPGKRENTCATLLCDAHGEGKKRNSPHAKTAGPSKASERAGFQSDARRLHLASGSNLPAPYSLYTSTFVMPSI